MSIGFSEKESEIFYHLIQGLPIATIAEKLNLPYREIRNIKSRRFHLIPIFIQRKLHHFTKADLSKINQKLMQLNSLVSSYVDFFKEKQVYRTVELNLSKRTINALIASNIRNTAELTNYSIKELLSIKSIGNKSIREIQEELERLDLVLKT